VAAAAAAHANEVAPHGSLHVRHHSGSRSHPAALRFGAGAGAPQPGLLAALSPLGGESGLPPDPAACASWAPPSPLGGSPRPAAGESGTGHNPASPLSPGRPDSPAAPLGAAERTGMLVHVVAGSGRAAVPGGSLSRSSPAFSEDFVQAVREPSDRLLHPFECIRLLGHASSVVEVEERPDPPPSAPSALRGDSRAEAAAAGQRDGAGQPCSRTSVVCERIEAAHLFADGLIRSLAVLPLPASRGGGLMAVVSVEQEECLMWAVHSPGDDEDPDSVNIVDTVCRRRDFCEHLLGLLRRSAREAGLAPQETVRAVYATTVGITSRNCLSTPAGLLRRSNLALHFGAKEPVAAAD